MLAITTKHIAALHTPQDESRGAALLRLPLEKQRARVLKISPQADDALCSLLSAAFEMSLTVTPGVHQITVYRADKQQPASLATVFLAQADQLRPVAHIAETAEQAAQGLLKPYSFSEMGGVEIALSTTISDAAQRLIKTVVPELGRSAA